MPGCVEHKPSSNLRIIVDTLFNKSFDSSYNSFEKTTLSVYKDIYKPRKLDNAFLTIVVVPYLNLRPLNYGYRICMFDAMVASMEPTRHRYYLTLCMTHQIMLDNWSGTEPAFFYMFEALREFNTLRSMDANLYRSGSTRLMQYHVAILNGDDNRLTSTTITNRKVDYVPLPNIVYKSK